MTKASREFFDQAYDLRNQALAASATNFKIKKFGPLWKHRLRASWITGPETLGDITRLSSSRRYLGTRALGDSGPTLLHLTDFSGVEDEYLIDFRTKTVDMLLGIEGYSLKGRIAETRGKIQESRAGFNEFDEARQDLVLQELQRGASGLYVYDGPEVSGKG